MEIHIRGKHLEVPDAVDERARLKFGRLEHFLPALQDASIEVHLSHEKAKEPDRRYVVLVTVSGHGIHLRAEERAGQLEKAIDHAAQVLSRQARRQKQKMYGRGRSGQSAGRSSRRPAVADAPGPAEAEAEAAEFEGIGRVKRFPVKPMTTEEALEQIKLLDRDFYIFQDADIDQFALLYRRKVGDYGLIIPELS